MHETAHSVMDIKSREPLQKQLARIIKNDLIKHMHEHDKLPPLKQIAKKYKAGFGVAQEAINQLRKQGIVYSRVGSGTFVSSPNKLEGELVITYPIIGKFEYALMFKKLLNLYSYKNPGAKILLRPSESNNFSEYVESIATSNEDVAIVTDSHLVGSKNIFIPLNENENKLIEDKCSSKVIELFKQGRKTCVWPMLYSPNVIFCNEDYFKKAGIAKPNWDWNLEQFLDIAEKLKEANPNSFPFWLTTHINRWYNILINSGVKTIGGKRNPLPDIDSPEFNTGAKLTKKLLNASPALLHEGELIRSFVQGRIGMIYGSYLSTLDCIKNYSDDSKISNIFIQTIPKIVNQNPILVGIGAGINSKAKNINQARDFCNFILSQEAQNIIADSNCGLPVVESVKIPQKIQINKIQVDNYNVFEHYKSGVVAKVSRQDKVWTAFCHEMQMYWSGIKSFEELHEDLTIVFNKQKDNKVNH